MIFFASSWPLVSQKKVTKPDFRKKKYFGQMWANQVRIFEIQGFWSIIGPAIAFSGCYVTSSVRLSVRLLLDQKSDGAVRTGNLKKKLKLKVSYPRAYENQRFHCIDHRIIDHADHADHYMIIEDGKKSKSEFESALRKKRS